ncbi:DUF3023 domain-containing protein [Ehrlichia chaffeensis]|uniref:DUF3023 domain-containing protein n=1 Tax=Ehrlichia chaffeensis TaxID=945 RepID=UPI0005C49037|nr:DUF3023 domain-containing protein [Ehrlichia chaffeensis]
MLNFSEEDHRQYNNVLCRNLKSMNVTVLNGYCVGTTQLNNKLEVSTEADEINPIEPSQGGPSLFKLFVQIPKDSVLGDPILTESVDFSQENITKLTVEAEVFAIVRSNDTKHFVHILDKTNEEKRKQDKKKSKKYKPLDFASIANSCNPVLVKPKAYANPEVKFDLKYALLTTGGLNYVTFSPSTPRTEERLRILSTSAPSILQQQPTSRLSESDVEGSAGCFSFLRCTR